MEIPSGDPQTGELYGGRSRAYTKNFGQIGIIVLQTVQVDKIERRQRVLKGSRMAPRAEKSENWQLRAAGAHTIPCDTRPGFLAFQKVKKNGK